MASKNNAVKEHAYRQIDREIKNDQLKNLLLFYGKEQYLVDWAMDAIVEKYLNKALLSLEFTRINGEDATLDEIIKSCETLPMASPQRVVLVSDFKLLEGAKSKHFGEEEEKKLLLYLKSLPDTAMLIFTCENPDKRRKLYKGMSDLGSSYDFSPLDEKSLGGFIAKRFKEWGKEVDARTIAQFIRASGYYDKETDYTLYNLNNDIKKIVAYNEDSVIGLDAICDTVSGNIDTNIFDLIDATSSNKKDQAFQLLHNLLSSGEKEYKILALICAQFEIVLSVKEMKEEGYSFENMREMLGVHEFRIKKAAIFAERYSLPKLYMVLQKAYEIDKNIKTGILESSLALEMFIAEI